MRNTLNPIEMRRNYANHPREYVTELLEMLETKTLRPENFSIRDCFINLIEGGQELYDLISYRKSGGAHLRSLMEAAGDAINSGDFASITGAFIFNKTKEGYDYPEALWPKLVETYQTNFIDGERIPGVGEFGAGAIEVIGEGEEFPMLGLNEEFTDRVPLQKRGFIAAVTKEMILKDNTGLLLKNCANGGKWLGINKDIRCIQLATGSGVAANNYNRNGIYTNTFAASGAYINQAAVTLTNWKSVETLELLFAGMTDPNTGTPIVVQAKQLLVPLALLRTSEFIRHATSVAWVDNTAAATQANRTYADNPLNKAFWGGPGYEILSNSFVSGITGSQAAWFLGDFRRGLMYAEAWGIEEETAAPQSPESWHRDIAQAWKVSEMGNGQVMEPRVMTRAN